MPIKDPEKRKKYREGYWKEYYKDPIRKEKHKKRVRKNEKEKRTRLIAEMNALKTKSGCAECGYNKHPAALDFAHIDAATKKFNISSMIRSGYASEKKLSEEIAKCRILCAICHRIETFEHNNGDLA